MKCNLKNIIFAYHDISYDNELKSLYLTKFKIIFYFHWEICRSEIMRYSNTNSRLWRYLDLTVEKCSNEDHCISSIEHLRKFTESAILNDLNLFSEYYSFLLILKAFDFIWNNIELNIVWDYFSFHNFNRINQVYP